MPCSPYFPTVVITTRVLEVFRVAHLRCPRFSIQPFVRALCDLHGVPHRPYLSTQFSTAFDIYLSLRAIIDKWVLVALGRDLPNWRVKNACPCCMYKVEDEPPLSIGVLACIDGNNSLSRFLRREREEITAEDDGGAHPGASKERADSRVPAGDYYLSRAEVDRWSKEGMADLMDGFVPDPNAPGWVDNEDGCTERWKNMKEDVVGRAWGMFDETGFFPSLCRHGFVLIVADMVMSGELYGGKYGFAITNHLIRIFAEMGLSLGLGYDIGCKFGKQIQVHPILGPLARSHAFRALVGAWHGHAHNCRCQLDHLAKYVEGVGREDLEGCESFFSKSNALAASTRYSTAFHRKQAITTYLKHTDTFDTYQGLSFLLASKYRRALEIKRTSSLFHEEMRRLGVGVRAEFVGWLTAEKTYLKSLSKEPQQETLQMEYYQKLVNLQDAEERVAAILGIAAPTLAVDAPYAELTKATRRLETQRRHALELRAKALAAVQDLEVRLDVEARWVSGGPEWEAAAVLMSRRRYQRALDKLEGLIISRMFELTKVNMSGTGYKLRKHIAKVLQVRSKAVKAALIRYNTAAGALEEPREALRWEQVVEYAFLADFDLLREGRSDIRKEPWALPSGRVAMDKHFDLLRADEELVRLDIEIKRLITHMRDEDLFLHWKEDIIREGGDEALAFQVAQYRMERGRFDDVHMEPGFTASLAPGVSVSTERRVPAEWLASHDVNMGAAGVVAEEDEDGEEADEDDLVEQFARILLLSHDPDTPPSQFTVVH
ncbi:hypothetical protein C8J57DRAFT_1438524 [Mycena rebaudengoi]|nr:hypothetical protein C8J57DRAFT_1438524 [Mycena rebaudengoi]